MDNSPRRKPLQKAQLFVLDEDFYPEIWKDDSKMSVLLNEFRPRAVNAEHYDQKMKFWEEMIEAYCDYKGSSSVSIEELKSVFKRKGTSIYCLKEVLYHMSCNGNLIEKDLFMQQPKTSLAWAVDSLLVKPLSWGFGKIRERLLTGRDNDQTVFVVKSSLKIQARTLLEHIRSRHNFNNIVSMDDVMAESDEIEGTSKEGILLALQYLHVEEKKVYMEENIEQVLSEGQHHKILLKFAEPHKTAQPITDIERSIYNLEQSEKFLHESIDQKEEQLNKILEQVKSSLREGKKQMAKTYLRKKHMIENDLTKTLNILSNVETMLQRIHSSKSDKDILKTYKMGSEAIKTVFADNGINIDSAEDIIEDLREVLADQQECQNILSEPLRSNIDEDDELEKELNDLLNKNDQQKPNQNGGETDSKKPIDDLNWIDKELEMRLRRLRSEFNTAEETTVPHKTKSSVPRITN